MTPLSALPDTDAFDRCVGPELAVALVRLEALADELAGLDRSDSVAAMTSRMKLEDERDGLQAAAAESLLAMRRALR